MSKDMEIRKSEVFTVDFGGMHHSFASKAEAEAFVQGVNWGIRVPPKKHSGGRVRPANPAFETTPPEQPTSVDTSVEVKMPSPNGIASGVYTPPPAETD